MVERLHLARESLRSVGAEPSVSEIKDIVVSLKSINADLSGIAGLKALRFQATVAAQIQQWSIEFEAVLAQLDERLNHRAPSKDSLERVNAAIIALKDAWWGIARDRLALAADVADLAAESTGESATYAYAAIAITLSSLSKLELRGRDSAGIHLFVTGHQLDMANPRIASQIEGRRHPLFQSGAVRTPAGQLSIVYKHAAEIGRLGDNCAVLRKAIRDDVLLREALEAPTAQLVVLGHTRWASVGMVNEANAHPVNSDEVTFSPGFDSSYMTAVLNGDVDNYRQLIDHAGARIAREITTDAKVIPVLAARRMIDGATLEDAVLGTVREFTGSVAIAMNCASDPSKLVLAQRGSGQALLVGSSEDMTIIGSELYGLVEHCDQYFRLDGSEGELVVVESSEAGNLYAARRLNYDGSPREFTSRDVSCTSITTRDIDRQGYPHFLKKELFEAPLSLQKTLRGRINAVDGVLQAHLSDDVLSSELRSRLKAGFFRRIVVIGQGTAAVAGRAVAAAIKAAFAQGSVEVIASTATEFSGFHLERSMIGTLVVAVSQSGTTTDTNRAVDLIRGRGGTVIAIVNRRGSDLAKMADGVMYTADGRDVEVSVASTKAFYSQIAAGILLAYALARCAGDHDDKSESDLLSQLTELPEAMREFLSSEHQIAELARNYAPKRPYWAVVGSALNRIAAEELRIKLSELTYRSISCDEFSDKKHIDLSAEPLILVCAAGLRGAAADDLLKEVRIFASHNSVPIVITDQTDGEYDGAAGIIRVPKTHSQLAFILSAMAGHLFGYYAALAIDDQCFPLKLARIAIERAIGAADGDPLAILGTLGSELRPIATEFDSRLRAGAYDSSMTASVSARIAVGLRAIASRSESTLMSQFAGPDAIVNELAAALTAGIDQVSRTIDTIRHQAKTVTVGTSRSDEAILDVPLVKALLANGASSRTLQYNTLRTVAALDPAVAAVIGATHYAVCDSHIAVVRRAGVAIHVPSRTDRDHQLRGTKMLVAEQQEVLAAVGQSDSRTVIIVPEVIDQRTVGLVLLHVEFHPTLPPPVMRTVLEGYRGRMSVLRGTVTEVLPEFDHRVLGMVSPLALLSESPKLLVQHWLAAAATDGV
ncbi:SIS domain-containing protein [Mycobacterium sp. SMC-8]|uniref:SIS domain-containing protein n=1 Tax=Mycobacterium sp. SMC-8 TaxID=2857060 RepID=UPI0021B2C260|nr:SIS domain-containing protein [Mycobacterium sp. SMC-8]UXA14950.1 SIS domain-containing protein [Mycobacterium sp. SMC-8]